ncbi:MAG: MtnX-like HAD-IB family phosphatase [Anaerolineales bacterium]
MTPSHKPGSLAVLCDFDGTIAHAQTMDFLYQRFASCGMEFARRWERGEIGTAEEIRSTFATVTASRQEMERALDEIELDPGFNVFLAGAEQRGDLVAIVSDGLDWYIEFLLKKHGIDGVPVYANHIAFEGNGFRFEFPYYHPDVPLRGVSKRHIVQKFRQQAERIVYVGDGKSDVEILQAVDRLYVKGWLADYCRQHKIEAIPFNNWNDLMEKWQEAGER